MTFSLNIRLRPVRFAFLVRPDDKAKVSDIFRVNTCLWGGQYNPIIPFFKRLPQWWDRNGHRVENAKQIVDGYLDFFEPDLLVESELGIATSLGFDKERVIQLSEILTRSGDRERNSYGFDVIDLYRDLYKREFQFVRRHKHNIVNVKSENVAFNPFTACIFGAFPTPKPLKYFGRAYKDAFDPKDVILNATSLKTLYESGCTSALHMGQIKLDVQHNEHSDPTLFILNAQEPRDLIDFWNLRAIYRNVLAIPVQWVKELSPFCKTFIKMNHRPLPGNSNGVMIHPTIMFSRSIGTADIDDICKQYFHIDQPGAVSLQTWYPPMWRPTPEFMVRTTRPTIEADEKRVDVPFDPEQLSVHFDPLHPDFSSKYGSRFRWANVVEMSDWTSGGNIATTFPCNYKNPLFPSFRLGKEQLLPTTEGLVIFPEHKGISERWTLMDGTTAINTWLKKNNISATLSDAGRSTQQIIQTLGGFWGVGKIAHAGIVNLLNEMSRKPITRSAHRSEFKNKIEIAVGKDMWRGKVFETLVERKAVELGLELKCAKCGSWSWYAVDHLDYKLNCDLCLKQFTFPIADPSGSHSAKWAYRVIGPFALPDYARGGYAAALAIRFFANVVGHFGRSAVTWSSGQELQLPTGKKSEADFILWYQRKQYFGTDHPTEIVFGEAKSFGKNAFDEKDIERMRLLANAFPGAVLVFATMKQAEDLSLHEIKLIRQLAEWGREFDRDRLQTRAPVVLLTGTELFAAHHLEQAWKEKGGKHAALIAHPSIRIDILKNLADFTQQIYLNMPSYHSWLDAKWKKRAELKKGRQGKKGGTKPPGATA